MLDTNLNFPTDQMLKRHLVIIKDNNAKWKGVHTVNYLYLDNGSYLLYTVWQREDVNSQDWIYLGLNKHVPYGDTTFIPHSA